MSLIVQLIRAKNETYRIEIRRLLSQDSEYNMANIVRVSHFFPTNFTGLSAIEITAKYKKKGKYWSY